MAGAAGLISLVFILLQCSYCMCRGVFAYEDTKCSETDERKRQLQGNESRAPNLSHQYATTKLDKQSTQSSIYTAHGAYAVRELTTEFEERTHRSF